MKLTISLAVFLLCSSSFIAAQRPTEAEMETKGRVTDHGTYVWGNGKAWKVLDAQSKVSTVAGIEEGIMLLLRESYLECSAADRAALESEMNKLTVRGFRMSDISDQIDHFYSDSSNLRIPVVDAYKYTMKKMHGANQQELADYAATLRATYNK